MKKLFFFASAAVLLATSCSDDLGLKNGQMEEIPTGNTKIIATYAMSNEDVDTRTTLVNNGTQKDYIWSLGDDLGIFNAGTTDNNDDTNAPFVYSGSKNAFYGDLDAMTSQSFYGYYPYSANNKLEQGKITLEIIANQNYNHQGVASDETWNLYPPTGAFAQKVAPAVAYGDAVEVDGMNQLNMGFKPVASYFILPVANYGEEPVIIQNLTLQVTYNGASPSEDVTDYQVLSGAFTVDVTPLSTNSEFNVSGIEPVSTTPDETNTTITLNCGKGVILEANGEPVNFWFVVPAWVELPGNNVVVKMYEQGTSTNDDANYTIVKNITTTTPQAGMNKFYRIVPEYNTPYAYGGTDSYVIRTQAQFLEYCYLATYGDTAIQQWISMMKGNSDLSNYSALPSMVVFAQDKTESDLLEGTATLSEVVVGLKNATVAAEINLNQGALNTAMPNLDLNASNIPLYYQGAYQVYYKNGYIPSIGNGKFEGYAGSTQYMPYKLLGNNSVNNLQVKGESVFVGSSETSFITVSGLTFNNISLDVKDVDVDPETGCYNLLAIPAYTNFEGVTINSVMPFVNATEGIAQVLFQKDFSSWYDYSEYYQENGTIINSHTGVNNGTSLAFANVLSINNSGSSVFDFTVPEHGITDYNNISMTGDAWGANLTISGKTGVNSAVEFLLNENLKTNGAQYSLISRTDYEPSMSYWTGGTYGGSSANATVTTAEQFAGMIQHNNINSNITLAQNLDLMGDNETIEALGEKFNQYWYAGFNSSGLTKTVSVSATEGKPDYEISNVYIDGSVTGKKSNGYLSLLGQYSITSNLVVNNISIVNLGEDAYQKPYIAAISNGPKNTSSVEVNGMNVNTSSANGAIGGLYYYLGYSTIKYLVNEENEPACSISGFASEFELEEEDETILSGWLAGKFVLNAQAGNSYEIYNPVSGIENDKLFGVSEFTINTRESNSATNIYLTGFGSTAPYLINSNNLYGTETTVNSNTVNIFNDELKQIYQYYAPEDAEAPYDYYVLQNKDVNTNI